MIINISDSCFHIMLTKSDDVFVSVQSASIALTPPKIGRKWEFVEVDSPKVSVEQLSKGHKGKG